MASKFQLNSTLMQPQAPATTKKQEPVAQKKSEVAPVQSALPPITQTQTTPVSVKGAAAVTQDPRFTQAVQQKFQQQLQQQQAEVQRQQAEVQKQIDAAKIQDKARISELLNKINTSSQTPEDIQEYQKLMSTQFKPIEFSDAYTQAQANLAALARMSGSDIARTYGVGGVGGVSGTGLVGGLDQTTSAARQYAQQAAQQESALKGQMELGKAKAEELSGMAGAGIKALESQYMGQLTEAQKADIDAKKAALDSIKAGMFLGTNIKTSDLQKLGLTSKDLSGVYGLDIKKIEGIRNVKDLKDLDLAVEDLKNKLAAGGELTPEQTQLIGMYDSISGLERSVDESGAFAYAKAEDLAKINAIRALKGETSISKEDLEKGYQSGKLTREDFNLLQGTLKDINQYEDYSTIKQEYDKNVNITSGLNELKSLVASGEEKAAYKKAEALFKNMIKPMAEADPSMKDSSLYEFFSNFYRNRTASSGPNNKDSSSSVMNKFNALITEYVTKRENALKELNKRSDLTKRLGII